MNIASKLFNVIRNKVMQMTNLIIKLSTIFCAIHNYYLKVLQQLLARVGSGFLMNWLFMTRP